VNDVVVMIEIFGKFYICSDAILPRRGPITRAMARRLQEYWVRDAREDPRVLMSLRIDFGPMG